MPRQHCDEHGAGYKQIIVVALAAIITLPATIDD